MTRHLTIPDFDRCLLDTAGLWDHLVLVLHQEFGINPDKFRREITQRSNGEAYDLFGHLAEYPFYSMRSLLQVRLAERDHLFADSPGFLLEARNHGDTEICTVGNDSCQRFKLGLSKHLRGIPQTVLPYNKGEWLRRQLSDPTNRLHRYDTILVVDDNPVTFEPLADVPVVELVQVVRPGAKYPATTQPGVRIVTSLSHVFAAVSTAH